MELASGHLEKVKKVLITAPSKDAPMFVMGNQQSLKNAEKHGNTQQFALCFQIINLKIEKEKMILYCIFYIFILNHK